jgi:hypothetical protein
VDEVQFIEEENAKGNHIDESQDQDERQDRSSRFKFSLFGRGKSKERRSFVLGRDQTAYEEQKDGESDHDENFKQDDVTMDFSKRGKEEGCNHFLCQNT